MLRRATRAVTAHYEAHFRGSGLRGTQFTMLSVLAQAGPLPMTRLADVLGVERTTLTRNLTVLARRGLVEWAGCDGRARTQGGIDQDRRGHAAEMPAALGGGGSERREGAEALPAAANTRMMS